MMNCGRCRSLFHYRRTKFQISLGQTRAFGWQGFCLPGYIWQCLVIFVVISTTWSGSGATGISAGFRGHHLSFYNSTETRLTKYGKRVEIRTAQYPFPMQRAGRRDNLETKSERFSACFTRLEKTKKQEKAGRLSQVCHQVTGSSPFY